MDTGLGLVLAFLGLFTLAIGQAVVRRMRNPYAEVAYAQLPACLRDEIERVLPGFRPGGARITRRRDEARVHGDYQGRATTIEADFDAAGNLVEFEADAGRGVRARGIAAEGDLPEAARREVDRVLGDEAASFQRSLVTRGTRDGQPHFEVKGRGGDWKWEIAVSADGRLLEVERERRRR